jgi:hypothetical protein
MSDISDNGASPVSPTGNETSSAQQEFHLDNGSIADNFARFTEHNRNSEKKTMTPTDDVQSQEEMPEKDELDVAAAQLDSKDSQSKENPTDKEKSSKSEGELTPGVKKRIDSLTARYKSEAEAHKKTQLENAKLQAAVEIMQREFDRISKRAQLDPHEEQIAGLKLQQEIDRLDREIPTKVESQYSERMEQLEVEERAEQMFTSMKEATAEYDGLFTTAELARFMAQNNIMDANLAAKQLGDKRLEAASKRFKQPPAPSTASGSASGTRNLSQPFQYKGAGSIAEFLENQEKARRGY